MSASSLNLYAGPAALAHIRANGLQPEHVASVFGASGAAKWLTIYGLDRALFEQWLPQSHQPVHLFGTSIGAWKLAAAGQRQAGWALNELAEGYIEQSYQGGINKPVVHRELMKILDRFLQRPQAEDLLSHPRFHYHCGVARCHGAMAEEAGLTLAKGMGGAFWRNLRGREHLNRQFDRVVFADPRRLPKVAGLDGIATEVQPLSVDNVREAVVASGSIPYVMAPKTAIAGAPQGIYRDGGLIDYHPVPGNFWQEPGLILYPHFYRWLLPGWYDKYLKSRRAGAHALDWVVMIAPSAAHVAGLAGGQIPDRKDFQRFKGNDAERQRRWRHAKEQSLALGEAFMSIARSGDWEAHLQPL
ncbi:hypothetical protein [Simiduia agarivorans]|uniref:Uncharacterized protein n=1 Tax=Simiduia agarivorans (strain DSM 21679 / JCM 13881 / BCRC 17597 / SA1) TaxID=1117647 RepID=K4KHR3_SIMAS|nr:hypothetical protein [Simiduia agarivorans]AFU98566.1 hypothetical protein M5M_06855 [Simiduia agarivorans SA1 = DSM 21679]